MTTDPTPPTPPTSVSTPASVNTSGRAKAPSTPSREFIRDVTLAIRNGASPYVASEWLNVPRKTFARWMREHDGLRGAVRQAEAHLKVKLASELAKRSPEKALRALQARKDRADEGRRYSEAARDYTNAGQTLVRRAAPFLVERDADDSVPATDLTPVEVAARELRSQMIADHGGAAQITAAKRALIDSILGSWIITQSLDAACMRMAGEDGLVSRKHRRAFPLVLDRMKAASVLSSQLGQLGLDRAAPPVQSLHEYIAQRSVSDSPGVAPQ